jgi:hypothetical protein
MVDILTTMSWAIFSSPLRVLKTESTQSFLLREDVFWAMEEKKNKRLRKSAVILGIRLFCRIFRAFKIKRF